MPRTSIALSTLALLSLASLPTATLSPACAARYHYGLENDDKENGRDPFGWALVRHGHNSSSSLDGENIEALRGKYGDDLLYIRDGDERYVIRDARLMRRAEDLMKPMEDAGKEIGAAVGAQVTYSLEKSWGPRQQARMAGRIGRLASRIARRSEEGEDTQDLEIEMSRLQQELDSMTEDRSRRHDREERESDLGAATERASRHMREATRNMNRELRDILREAKSRHLAESVED